MLQDFQRVSKNEDRRSLHPHSTSHDKVHYFWSPSTHSPAKSDQPCTNQLVFPARNKELERSSKRSRGSNINQQLQEQVGRALEASKIRYICCMKCTESPRTTGHGLCYCVKYIMLCYVMLIVRGQPLYCSR